MDTPEKVYRKLATRFSEVVAVVPDQAWDQPSPCEGWTARGVLEHVIGAEADFVEQRGLALSPPGPSPASEPVSAWDHVRSQIQTILDDPERAGIVYEGHFGSTTIGQAIEDFYCFDLIVHRWDIAEATGGDTEISRAEIAFVRSKLELYGDAMRMPGVFGAELEAPAGADEQTALLAFIGRRA